MSVLMYATAKQASLTGGLNLTDGTLKVAFVGSGYTANIQTDQYYSSVTGVIGTPMTLANPTVTVVDNGDGTYSAVFDADDVTSATLATGSTITQLVLFEDTGTATTSQLVANETGYNIPTNGGMVTINWPATAKKILAIT